ncbi:hypothetical protein CROQUDRAFT_650348 [Cronartium quercuum f. sp. fusiforme G11]|uniref:RNA-dependent RNA polymerase n=1 Tax=Cronartium quercuum f. sp. fusiforme G11 TaxID=708437 RepID=A0A9P6THM6_9BASI|nr:hypothetical protein CROQUDRAFT_650348 [Cronartium quercuum f. sp. fusiforme G11]
MNKQEVLARKRKSDVEEPPINLKPFTIGSVEDLGHDNTFNNHESKVGTSSTNVNDSTNFEGSFTLSEVNGKTCTTLFDEKVDQKLAKLPNSIVRWEIGRSIFKCPPDVQESIIETHPHHDHQQFTVKVPAMGTAIEMLDSEGIDPRLLILIQTTEIELSTDRTKLLANLSKFSSELGKPDMVNQQQEQQQRTTSNDLNRLDKSFKLSNVSKSNLVESNINDKKRSAEVIKVLLKRGNIRFRINLSFNEDKRCLKKKLKPCQIGDSNHWQRNYGSNCFLQIKLSENLLFESQKGKPTKNNKNNNVLSKLLWDFLNNPLIFAQKVYKAAILKNDTVWFFTSPSDLEKPITLTDLIEKDMPIELNQTMRISKFNARLQLSLSSTTPTINFKPYQIRRVPDIMSTSLVISTSFMEKISESLKLGYLPSIIEGAHHDSNIGYTGQRYGWVMCNERDRLGGKLIQIRESQQTQMCHDSLRILFQAKVYDSKKFEWIERQSSILILKSQIHFIKMSTTHTLMTDGAAAISLQAAINIKDSLGLKVLPAVYQARIMKAKGLWYLSSLEPKQKGEIWIEIRDSQWKAEVSYQPNEDIPFNLCQFSRRAKPGHLNRQTIPVLASRHVPVTTFTKLLEQEFTSVLESLTDTNSLRLAGTLEDNVQAYKKANKELPKNEVQDDHDDLYEKYSHRPLNPIWECAQLLKSGFEVRDRRVIDRLVISGQLILDGMINFKLGVPCSTSVYAMPDPTGTLKEDEVFLQLSRFTNPDTNLPLQDIRGECIIARSPCVHPCDARKVKAVANRNLEKYDDVLICSVLGERSLLDYLSGGDYDGDTVTVIWDPNFTQPFVNAEPTECISEKQLKEYDKYFKDNTKLPSLPNGTVSDFVTLKNKGSYEEALRESQLVTLFQTVDFGRYSQMHKVLEYLYGVGDQRTQKFGHIYVKCLDAAKQGISLVAKANKQLKKEFESLPELRKYNLTAGIPLPPWTCMVDPTLDKLEWRLPDGQEKRTYLSKKPEHVLEAFVAVADQQKARLMNSLKELEPQAGDSSLTQRWTEFQKGIIGGSGHALREFLNGIVKRSYVKYREVIDKPSKRREMDLTAAWKIFHIEGSLKNAKKAVIEDQYSSMYLTASAAHGYCLLKASAAASIMGSDDHFVFHMSFTEVCNLKTAAVEYRHLLGNGCKAIMGRVPKAITPEFNEAMRVKKKLAMCWEI